MIVDQARRILTVPRCAALLSEVNGIFELVRALTITFHAVRKETACSSVTMFHEDVTLIGR